MAGSGADALRHCYRIETRKRNENGTRVYVPVHFFKTGRTRMRTPFVKRQTTPESGFLLFSAFGVQALSADGAVV